jgi:hypothetical protein
MSRMDREVNIYTTLDTARSNRELRWFAEVEGRGNRVIYTTTWHQTEDEALEDAAKWIKETGHVEMAF